MREKSSMNKLQHKRIDDENRFLGTLGQGSVQLNRSSFSACLSLIHCILVRELKSEESLLMYDILLMGYLLLLMWKPCIIPNQLIAIYERPTYNMYLYVTCEYGCCVCAIFNPQKYYIICIEHTRFPSLLVSLSSFGCHCHLTHSEHTKKKRESFSWFSSCLYFGCDLFCVQVSLGFACMQNANSENRTNFETVMIQRTRQCDTCCCIVFGIFIILAYIHFGLVYMFRRQFQS